MEINGFKKYFFIESSKAKYLIQQNIWYTINEGPITKQLIIICTKYPILFYY